MAYIYSLIMYRNIILSKKQYCNPENETTPFCNTGRLGALYPGNTSSVAGGSGAVPKNTVLQATLRVEYIL